MGYKTEATPNFARELKPLAKKYPSLIKEIKLLQQILSENPTYGTPLGKGCYKIRVAIASKNKGKSGGARIITHIVVEKETIYLVSIYDKSEQADINEVDMISLLRQIHGG